MRHPTRVRCTSLQGTAKVLYLEENWRQPDAKGAFRALQPEPHPAPGAEDSPGTAFSWRHGDDSLRGLRAELQPRLASVAR